MSLEDSDLPPAFAHHREVEAQRTRDLMAQTEAADREQHRRELEQRDECETPEAEDARWAGIFQRSAWERPEVHYVDAVPDRRLHDRDAAVADGLLRDLDPPGVPL